MAAKRAAVAATCAGTSGARQKNRWVEATWGAGEEEVNSALELVVAGKDILYNDKYRYECTGFWDGLDGDGVLEGHD